MKLKEYELSFAPRGDVVADITESIRRQMATADAAPALGQVAAQASKQLVTLEGVIAPSEQPHA